MLVLAGGVSLFDTGFGEIGIDYERLHASSWIATNMADAGLAAGGMG